MQLALILAAAAFMAPTRQVKLDPDLGVSETLAAERAARVSNLRYDLAFTIPAQKSAPLEGRELIRFTLQDASSPLVLDYAPDRAGMLTRSESNGAATAVRQVNGHLIVPAAALRSGENA